MNIKVLKKCILLFVNKWYYFNVKFEKGFSYQRVKVEDLRMLEAYHLLLSNQGWERYTDIECGFNTAWVWYRSNKLK